MQQSSNKPAPTAAQQAMLHVVQSAGLSGLVSLLVAVTQYLTNNGNIDVHTLLSVLGGGFLTALTMIWKSVSTNPNLAQAALDLAQQAHDKIDQIAPWLAKPAKPAPTPIVYSPAQSITNQPQSGGGVPADYYTSVPRRAIPEQNTMSYPAAPPMGAYNLNTGQAYPSQPPAQQQPGQSVRGG